MKLLTAMPTRYPATSAIIPTTRNSVALTYHLPPVTRVFSPPMANKVTDPRMMETRTAEFRSVRRCGIKVTAEPRRYDRKWVQNIAVAAAEAILLSVLFLAVDVPEMLWTRHVENGIVQRITTLVG